MTVGGEGKSSGTQERRFVAVAEPPVAGVVREPSNEIGKLVVTIADLEDDRPLAVI